LFTLKTLSLGNSVLVVKILTINTEFPKLTVFNVNNGIPLEKLVECTLTTLFLVGLTMAG